MRKSIERINEAREKNLTTLDLARCKLTSLPPEITALTGLTTLNLSNNQLTSLPPEIGALTSLTTLNLFDNQLRSLPPEILSIQAAFKWQNDYDYTEGITLGGNPLQSPPAELVQKGDAAVRAYFADLAETHPLREVKLLLVGDGGAGKTSLAKRLRGEAFDLHECVTHGINIDPWDVRHPDGGAIKAHLWDFGGQEIMHATHQFFLSHRSLYLLVLDGRRDEKTEYWLKHIESFGRDSPVFVILNKIDENPAHAVNQAALQKKYPNIRGFFRISCAQKKGIDALVTAIEGLLPKLEMLQTLWPKRWFLVKQALEQKKAPFLDFDQYQALCLDQGITEETVREVLVTLLHDLGVAIHFPDFELLDTYVLDPHWVTTAVYRIVNNPGTIHANGVLALGELRGILKKQGPKDFTYPVAKHPYIISIMKKFELCYPLPENRILVPDLLPVQEPAFDFDGAGPLRFRIRYEFLPRTVMPRLIVKRHTQVDNGLQWRTGVVLASKDHQARAVIRADYEDRFIEVLVNGPLKRDFLVVIRETLREINQGFRSNALREHIACNCTECQASSSPYFHDYGVLLKFFAKGSRTKGCDQSIQEVPIAQLLGDVLGTQESQLETILNLIKELKDEKDTPDTLLRKVEGVAAVAGISGATLMELVKLILKYSNLL